MKDTITAKTGYLILISKQLIEQTDNENIRIVADGEKLLFSATKTDYETYMYNRDCNECFVKYEVFTTIRGKQLIYWSDLETDEDFITEITEPTF